MRNNFLMFRTCRGLPLHFVWPILAVFGLVGIVYQPLVRAPLERAFEERGVETRARIVELFEVDRGLFSSRRHRRNKRARFEFTTQTGRRLTTVERVSRKFFFRRDVGDTVTITYLPDQPTVHRLHIGSRGDVETMFRFFIIFTGVMSGLTWYSWRGRLGG